MNIYFLLEGSSTEIKFYPELVSFIFGDRLTRISNVNDVTGKDNSYFVLTGNGYPQIYTHILTNTIRDILEYRDFTHLFVCIDADESSVEERIAEFDEIYENLVNQGLDITDFCEVNFIAQNRCIETWFLGNKRAYRQNTTNPLMLRFNRFYNVKTNDPELMNFDIGYNNHASYHYSYLRQMASENRRRYVKNDPSFVCEAAYIGQMISRFKTTNHIKSFGVLLTKLFHLNQTLTDG